MEGSMTDQRPKATGLKSQIIYQKLGQYSCNYNTNYNVHITEHYFSLTVLTLQNITVIKFSVNGIIDCWL